MKFRVETWDTTDRRECWRSVYNGNSRDDANYEYDWFIRYSLPTERIRLSEKKWNGWVTMEAAGIWKETKPMASRIVYDCGCASCGEDWYPCCEGHDPRWRPKETKPMSTKQRIEHAHAPRREKCVWVQDEPSGHYNTECGHAWFFECGDIKENQARFCPYCGGEIR